MEKKEFEIDEYTKKVFDLEFQEISIDLRTCIRGTKMITRDGTVVYYVQPLSPDAFYHHEISAKEDLKVTGFRNHNGQVLKNSLTDNDIVEIIRE